VTVMVIGILFVSRVMIYFGTLSFGTCNSHGVLQF